MTDSLDWCLLASPRPPRISSVQEWRDRWLELAQEGHSPFDRAVRGGFESDRCGWAFASGYQASLHVLAPMFGPAEILSLCVTEADGNRPRHIKTTLSMQPGGYTRVAGCKRWSTLSTMASTLLVVAIDEAAAERNNLAGLSTHVPLRVAAVPTIAAGVVISPMPVTAFVPEIPHGIVELRHVAIRGENVLPGDGFEQYVKPFRTVEDIYVTAAALAYLLREARASRWSKGICDRIVATLVSMHAISTMPTHAPSTHIALAGALVSAEKLYGDAMRQWESSRRNLAAGGRWTRDISLFQVASDARRMRTRRAWDSLSINTGVEA